MSKNIFRKDYRVNYYEIDILHIATPCTIIQYLEDVSMEHSIQIGFGPDTMYSMDLCWILNKWNIKMTRYPKWGEKITIETWVSNYERIFAKRDYRIIDANNETIGNITSRWIFYNFNKKRPVRILPEIIEGYNISSNHAVKDNFERIHLPDTWDFEKQYYIRRTDIDINNHVNNKIYIEWLIDTIPEDVYNKGFMKEIEIMYSKESYLDSIINSKLKEIDISKCHHEYIHGIYDQVKGEYIACARSVWVY